MTPTIHLAIPCFRESTRLPRFLPSLCEAMDALGGMAVQVVDDGSGAAEEAAARSLVDGLRPLHPCLQPLLALPVNHGKGGAVYAGWRSADPNAAWLGFVDADGSLTPEEVARLIRWARERGSRERALFGSRVKMLGRRVERQFKRHLIGRIYATLVSELLNVPVYDSQCGLKLVPRAAWEKVRDRLRVEGFAFDVELMVALLDSGCEVVEVPVDWHETPGGKVRLLHDSWRMFQDVLRIRRRRNMSWKT